MLTAVSYAFGEFVLDTRLFQLRRGGLHVPMEPKVFDVLRYLVEHADRVVTKHELLDALWHGESVSESVLPTNVNALRRALGQERGARAPIETVHGRGYRFATKVTRQAPAASEPADPVQTDAPSHRADDTSEGPFVGQQVVQSRLKRAVVRALAGQGQICILRGDAGIGKTRIAHDIVQLLRSYGADAWVGGCPEGVGTPPLWIWQEVLRSARAVEGTAALKRLLSAGSAGEVPQLLAAWLDEQDHALLALSERDRFRMHDALLRLISTAAKLRPKVLWLEDLHHADDASGQVLRLLAPHLEQLPVLVICTVRSRDDLTVALPVQRHVDDLARLSYCQRIHVPPLELEDTRALVTALLGAAQADDLSQLVHQKSSGNPLFIREIVDTFAAHGRLDDLGALRGLTPSDAIRHVLRRRVQRLGPSDAKALEALSVLTTDLDVALAGELSGLTSEALYGMLQRAEQARLLVRVPERLASYRFVHSLLRETLYTELDLSQKRALHLRAARCLENREAVSGFVLAREIAHHLVQALPLADAEHTADWLANAGQECLQAGAFEEALRAYGSALEVGRSLAGLSAERCAAFEAGASAAQAGLREAKLVTPPV
jgi:DNA-binding winged helix-turn-helix (wHTH) protein/predicted ATPase